MEHPVFDIKRFAVHDGPGIRTTVFLKGCMLNCPWCQNPEGLNANKELMYNVKSCINCQKCVEACNTNAITAGETGKQEYILVNRHLCNLCGDCIEVCPTKALKFDSKLMTPEFIVNEVLKDKVFYEQGEGGVTFSGGDPLFNYEFLLKCVMLCRNYKLHIAIETSLMHEWKVIEQFINLVDLFIVDIKLYDDNLHDKIVGGKVALIKENIQKLNKSKANILLRTPLIPGYTATEENLKQIGVFYKLLASENKNIEFELLNYNPYTKTKYKMLDRKTNGVPERGKYTDNEMREFYGMLDIE